MDIVSAYKAGQNIELKGFMASFKEEYLKLNGNRNAIRKLLNEKVSRITEETFNQKYTADVIITYINAREEICKQYANTDLQVAGIISWLPRMMKYKDKLEKYVSKERKKYGLKI